MKFLFHSKAWEKREQGGEQKELLFPSEHLPLGDAERTVAVPIHKDGEQCVYAEPRGDMQIKPTQEKV